jgi:HAD superfamily hydrolase (TIGR01509 family)
MIKAVIFDMDGVLVDSEPAALAQQAKFLKKMGHTLDEEFAHSLLGITLRKYWEVLKDHLHLEQDVDELMHGLHEHMLDFWRSSDIEKNLGIAELLVRLRDAGIRSAIATSASSQRLPLFLKKLGLEDAFEATVNANDIQNSKPAPDIYILAAKRLGVDPRDCVAIEDAQNGVLSARAAGMKVIGYKVHHNKQDLSKADIVLSDFHDVTIELLNGL